MAAIFMEPGSAATQDLSLWSEVDQTSATVASDSQSVKTSARSISVTCSGGFTKGRVIDSITPNDAGRRGSFYFRMGQAFSHNEVPIFGLQQDGGSPTFSTNFAWYIHGNDGDQCLHLSTQHGGVATGTTVINANQDYRISWAYTINPSDASQWTFELYIDGVLEFSVSNPGVNSAVSASWLWYGYTSVVANSVPGDVFYYAHIYTDDGTTGDVWNGVAPASGEPQLGVTAKRPIANGTTNGFTTQIGSGGSGVGTGHAPQVNERPLSETNGWSMVGAGAAVTEEYSVQSASAGDKDISSQSIIDFMGWLWAKSLASETAQIIVAGVASNISLTSTSAAFMKIAGSTTYPSGNTDIGIITSVDLTTVSLFECGVIVAYQPPSGPPPTPAPRFLRRM